MNELGWLNNCAVNQSRSPDDILNHRQNALVEKKCCGLQRHSELLREFGVEIQPSSFSAIYKGGEEDWFCCSYGYNCQHETAV